MAISSDLIFRFRLQRLSLAFRCRVSREWPSAEPEVLASNLKKGVTKKSFRMRFITRYPDLDPYV